MRSIPVIVDSHLRTCCRPSCDEPTVGPTNSLCHRHWAEYNRQRRAADPSIVRRENLKRRFQITIAEYDAMLVRQHGVCAICSDPPGKKRLCVDHEEGGRIRGLLCDRCNTAIGLLDHDAEVIEHALEYLR